MMLYLLYAIILALITLKIYLKICEGRCHSKRRLDGKTVIVTGANSGIGFETSKDLASRGAKVIMACRNLDRGNAAKIKVIKYSGNNDVHVRMLNLSLNKSVRSFVKDFLDQENRLDVLICNAGMSPPPGNERTLTEENTEIQFASNHLGHFQLVNLLLDLMKQTGNARVVIVSSVTHIWAPLDFDNLNLEKQYRDPYWQYCTTKLLNLLHALELSRRLEGTNVTSNAVHPGAVYTSIARNGHWYTKYVIIPCIYWFAKSAAQGAQPVIYLAVSEEVESVNGKYFVDCKPDWIAAKAASPENGKILWQKCEQMLDIIKEKGKLPLSEKPVE